MEIEVDEAVEFIEAIGVIGDVGAEGAVVESAEVADDAINHGGTENTVFFVDLALPLETVGGGHATVR